MKTKNDNHDLGRACFREPLAVLQIKNKTKLRNQNRSALLEETCDGNHFSQEK